MQMKSGHDADIYIYIYEKLNQSSSLDDTSLMIPLPSYSLNFLSIYIFRKNILFSILF